MNPKIVVTYRLALEKMSDVVIAAANNSLTGFGKISSKNTADQKTMNRC